MAILSPKCTLKASIDHHGPVHRPAAQCVQLRWRGLLQLWTSTKSPSTVGCNLSASLYKLRVVAKGTGEFGIIQACGISEFEYSNPHIKIDHPILRSAFSSFSRPPTSKVPNCPGRTFQIMSVSFLHHNAHRSTLHPSSQPRTPTPRRRGHRHGQRRSDGSDGSGWAWAGGRGSRGTGSPRTPRWQFYRGNGDWSHSRHEVSYGLKKLGSKCGKCDSNGWMCVRNVVLVRFSVWMRNHRM